MENIDEEADIYGIDFVKNDEPQAARNYHIYNTPALVNEKNIVLLNTRQKFDTAKELELNWFCHNDEPQKKQQDIYYIDNSPALVTKQVKCGHSIECKKYFSVTKS